MNSVSVLAGGGTTQGWMGGQMRVQLSRRNVMPLASCRSLQTSRSRRGASVGLTLRWITHSSLHFCRVNKSLIQVKSSRNNTSLPLMQVGGLPTPDICWYLDGKAIRPDDYHKMLVCEKGLHSFIIEIITVHHAGVYECVAKNRAGESRFTMRLDVLGKCSLLGCAGFFFYKIKNNNNIIKK